MSDISPINSSVASRVGRIAVDPSIASNQSTEEVRGRGGARPSDRVEFSQVSQYLSKLQSEPTERSELVNRVRDEIQAGTYLTEDKLSSAADGLLDDINFAL
tara:strand:- start:323503 stop:323808 length:306 start_codon:yes stop_codon:yes gene_type:complete